ncbi:MAG: alkaline phosphatase [Myxococcota bacterium]
MRVRAPERDRVQKTWWLVLGMACAGLASAECAGAGDPTTFAAGREAVARALDSGGTPARAKNVIVFLGDGMGVTTVTAARIFEGQREGAPGEEHLLSFERFPHLALIKTYNTNQQVPDSAGTMTAIVTGTKTRAGVLSVDRRVARGDYAAAAKHPLETIVEQAEARGLSTGIVTTTTLTHATPAALFAHSPEREWQSDDRLSRGARDAGFPDIARQFVEFDSGDGIDVALGGGFQHFLPTTAPDASAPERRGTRADGRDLTAEWLAGREKAAVVWNRTQLREAKPGEVDQILGLFGASYLDFELDRRENGGAQPSLSEMTAAAIAFLERDPDGYFLMVEAGRIDHAHHAGNAHRALTDTIEISDAVRVAAKATDADDTLIIVTADHSHVLTMAGYPTRGNDILGKVVGNDERGEPDGSYSKDANGRPYTTLGYQNGPGADSAVLAPDRRLTHGALTSLGKRSADGQRPDLRDVNTADPDFLQQAAIPMSSETHSGEDVAAYARGPGSNLFTGVREQHYIYHAMVEALGWNAKRGEQ